MNRLTPVSIVAAVLVVAALGWNAVGSNAFAHTLALCAIAMAVLGLREER